MKTCDGCKYANWKKTTSGRLHPDKSGRCTYEYVVPPLPACMYYINSPHPTGGTIWRGQEFKEHCPYWQDEKKVKV